MRKAREKVNSKGAQWEIIIGSCQGWGRGANSVISCEVGRIPLRISPQNYKTGLPWWFSGKESACQCKRHRFDPQFGKILYAAELSLCATTTEPMHCNYWSPHILEPVSATRKATVIRSPSIAISKEHPAQSEKKKKNPTRQFNLFLVKWGSEAVFVFGGAGSSMKCGSSSSKCTAFSSNGALAQLPHSIWDPGSPTRDRIHRIHNLWTTREVPSEV